MNPIAYRPATADDVPAALAISAHFPDDWLRHGLGPMLEAGTLFVAEEAGPGPGRRPDPGLGQGEKPRRMVAVCGYQVLGEVAWLQAMRVHPDYHNQGIATDFTRYILERCRRSGLRRARLDTTVDNHPVHHFIQEKLGFRALGNFCFERRAYDPDNPGGRLAEPAPVSPEAPTSVRPGQPADLEAIWSFLERRAGDGHLAPAGLISPPDRGGDVVDFGRDELARWLAAGNVLVAEDESGDSGQSLTGVALWGRVVRIDQLRVTYLEGRPAVQAELLRTVLKHAVHPVPPHHVALRLPRTQWQTLAPLLEPVRSPEDPSPEADSFFEAVVYEKELLPPV